jgi:hypothetical protein
MFNLFDNVINEDVIAKLDRETIDTILAMFDKSEDTREG